MGDVSLLSPYLRFSIFPVADQYITSMLLVDMN